MYLHLYYRVYLMFKNLFVPQIYHQTMGNYREKNDSDQPVIIQANGTL